jgi:hypothetical protein
MNFEHKKIVERIARLDEPPSKPEDFSLWLRGDAHIAFLEQNARADEIVVFASGEHTFINAVAVADERLSPIDRRDLMGWNFNAHQSIASLVSSADDIWIERGLTGTASKTLDGGVQLIFGRVFEEWSGPGRSYLELHQEYAHLSGIHWRSEKRAHCRFNKHGDLEQVVSITTRDDKGSDMALATFRWEPLEEYLAAGNASLVRMFDIPLYRKTGFSGWSSEPPEDVQLSDEFFFHRRIDGGASYLRGVQIIRPRRPKKVIFPAWGSENEKEDKQYAEFIAEDWRNKRVTKISTDPAVTTNYFEAAGNSLPYELSPAFFRPDVLLKYKADREKYTVGEREVSCRAAWHLRGIDVNEAGQVHAYIVYLRSLPYTEQMHWLAYNEAPKARISQRAYTTDFKGDFSTIPDPVMDVMQIVHRWQHDKVPWWTLRDEKLLERVNTPLSASRDEWAEAFMDLAKLVVEGFETKPIRARLDAEKVPYDKDDKTIALLEKLLNKGKSGDEVGKLTGLRTVQYVRTKAKGHTGGIEGDQLVQDVLTEHETFANHFRHVCGQVSDELETVENFL